MIIRTKQHWLGRVSDIVLTLVAWACFVGLVASSIAEIQRADRLESVYVGDHFLGTISSLALYITLGGLMAVTLFGWARYNQLRAARYERRQRMADIGNEVLSRSFYVDSSVLNALQQQQRMIMHLDQSGHLESVELPGLGLHLDAALPYVPGTAIDYREHIPATPG
ncbi:poly-beta-1,6-N-acetyl-D-glucosamine biosynthesis protein PgaD [Pseudomonas sp.]|uniref:poly-beta-1,6-N-acetyl-D-glucosamine biosynthesis protein PgaD n=1 Tax=Pseudomonas sp. TaxID=306 RepID=UPI00272B6B31|nr:poly-beta-1,6-N-acetyl-D-glucosamine biosynthesis protein PgaD [Pseudomonas sp.]